MERMLVKVYSIAIEHTHPSIDVFHEAADWKRHMSVRNCLS